MRNGYIKERRRKDGTKVYDARWRDPQGHERSHTCATKTEARQHLTKVANSLMTGAYTDPALGRVTVLERCNRWLDGRDDVAPRTITSYRNAIDNHIAPHLGRRR